MSFSDFYVTHRTRKSNFLNQIDQLIDWKPIEQNIRKHYDPGKDVTGRPAYSGLLLFILPSAQSASKSAFNRLTSALTEVLSMLAI